MPGTMPVGGKERDQEKISSRQLVDVHTGKYREIIGCPHHGRVGTRWDQFFFGRTLGEIKFYKTLRKAGTACWITTG